MSNIISDSILYNNNTNTKDINMQENMDKVIDKIIEILNKQCDN